MTTTEMIEGLDRLAGIMQAAEFKDWATWCKSAVDELQRRKDIAFVMHTNHADGTAFSAFWSKELAAKSVEEDSCAALKELEEEGYVPRVLRWEDRIEIYAADSNINYEWLIAQASIIEKAVNESKE